MKRLLIIVYSAFLVILIANIVYYKNLYNKQISYITTLLDRQVQIVGLSIDDIDNRFISDINEICFSEDLTLFFTSPELKAQALDKMKLFFSKYQQFVTGIKLYDNARNEFTLKRDEMSGEWLEQQFVLHSQSLIHDIEKLTRENRNFEYYLPVIRNNKSVANIVVSVDYQKYFDEVFSVFNMKEYQWQWVVSDSGQIIYDNAGSGIRQIRLDRIIEDLENTTTGNLVHKAEIDGKDKDIISSFYSTRLLQRDLGVIFSAPTDFFQKYIIRNSFLIVLATLLILLGIITLFLRYIKLQRGEIQKLSESERMLYKLIEEMPVAVIIHNKKREILKANKVAALLFSYSGEEEMIGEIFPEQPVTTAGNYFAKNLGGEFNPEKFVIISQKGGGEQILYKNSIPVVFTGEEANLEILIDVTMLESARQQQAKANEAKSEFLARMSYEIRTPLNGIIGITDIINRYEVSDEVKNVVGLLRRSTEILLNIINDILDFSRIEAGEMILDEIPFNLREELNYCADLTRTFISDRDIVFSYQVENNVPESVVGDPVRVRQILINLILHSVINTEKGEISLKCGLKENDNGILKLEFELRDTGNSFTRESLVKIFGEMRDIESRISAGKDESVLGTILARQLIEMMGGELSAESPSGLSGDKGTRVLFTLATYSNDRIIKNLDLKRIDSFEKIRTLVITGQQYRDEEIMTLFHKLGLNVSVTTFQRLTVEQLKANVKYPDEKYDMVVIIDDKDFDGFEAAASIRENNLSGNFIVQLISSNDRKGNFLKSVKMGVDHYLVKPFDKDEFVRALLVSFPYIESQNYSNDLTNTKKDINILIVEDNKMNLKVLGTMLTSLGYLFESAGDGYEGFLMAKEKRYDVIFMDLLLPEIDGFESARKILALDKSVLIVAFTADNMPDTKRKAELSGIKEFIAKPVRIEELKRLFSKYFKMK